MPFFIVLKECNQQEQNIVFLCHEQMNNVKTKQKSQQWLSLSCRILINIYILLLLINPLCYRQLFFHYVTLLCLVPAMWNTPSPDRYSNACETILEFGEKGSLLGSPLALPKMEEKSKCTQYIESSKPWETKHDSKQTRFFYVDKELKYWIVCSQSSHFSKY